MGTLIPPGGGAIFDEALWPGVVSTVASLVVVIVPIVQFESASSCKHVLIDLSLISVHLFHCVFRFCNMSKSI